ncbi:MAG: CDP-diacylglycerol--glycerol-3-phosphate 3-phosphatidyltransferase [Ruminococcus sp.]|nr:MULTISPECIES: CDP-diacylglycerol--glycerol-3-phosphate 3-phosphatidyltransferase [Ruminococcus]MCI5617817.1 CDP-diacylglycerol--glycerol-3-phosphate 3-phosphatidyltransferase [Ruminococcus sp.]MDD5889119.1 CDP-diacylglycerol--glycerol-3-phosphate 3-phosphatidyltransferase [Ruminococcus sp.]MDD6532025.1 CDP-diacylglycerol--glycerol-3-phosphate 3-phosphatidyltransferase [Ruminococcus sp.]MDD6708677.1 CDP-diacylglycerol--glycerol-3-phosphate 3-phosphatidyltransferase [Ruminococcus sp.]MDY36616
MNLPNKLTLLRIILVPFFIIAMLVNFPFHYLVAGCIFGIASVTDTLDGKIARSRNLVTDFGKFADPLADKILVLTALVCFLQVGLLGSFGAIPVIIVLFREFAVSGIRLVAASSGKVVAANIWGKIKTVSQMVGISVIFAMQVVLEVLNAMKISTGFVSEVFYYIGNGLIWLSTLFTLISGIIYLKDNIGFLKDN